MPEVTVILPVFNAEKTVEPAIKSILEQSFSDFELLIYDDCSSDNSINVITSLKDSRINLFTGSHNLGSLKARNFLLNKAKGDYIVFQDADDISMSHRLERLVNFMRENSEYAICGSSAEIYDVKGRLRSVTKKPTSSNQINEEFKKRIPIIFATSIVRRSVYEDVGGFRDFFFDKGNYDYDWMYRIAEKYNCANLDEPLYQITRMEMSNSKNIINPYKIIGQKLVQLLAEERAENGKDSLDLNNFEKLNSHMERLFIPYRMDRSLYTQDRISGMMAEKMYSSAFSLSIQAIKENPKRTMNYRSSFYIFRKWFISFFTH